MTRVEVLNEYETRPVRMSPRTASVVSRLGGSRIQVLATSQDGIFELKASQWVGTLVTDELEVLVRPKVGLDNLLLLLDTGLSRDAWEPEVFAFAAQPRVLPAFASFFARTVEQALGRGLRRDYKSVQDRLPALRGRIRFRELARRPGMPLPLPVSYEEYTADILENRGIKAALRRLLRVAGVQGDTRRLLTRELVRLEGVADAAVPPYEIDEPPITRLNRHYEPALRLAAIILRNLTLVDLPGRAVAGAFMLNMNDVFQDFIERRLRRELRGRLDVVAEPTRWLDRRHKVRMWPDLEFRRGGDPVLVGDVKYKLLTGETARSSDYYQLLAYATALDLDAGMLIYCLTEDSPPPATVRISNTAIRLHTATIDLSGGDETLRRSIDTTAELAEELASVHPRSQSGSAAQARAMAR